MTLEALFSRAQPLEGLLGGVMIGLAAALLLLGDGRIAGVSGLLARALGLAQSATPRALAWLFLVGLAVGALVANFVAGPVEARFPSLVWLVAGGLLVGFGTRLGGGCTSGHGVCGMARLSRRSLLATFTFMASGIATVAVANWLGVTW